MRLEWWIATAFVLIGSVGTSAFLLRRGLIPKAQAVAIAVLGFALVFIALWGMKSHFIRNSGVEVPQPAKRILLAMTGGLLAQMIVLLDRFLRRALPKNKVAPIYVRGVLGALAGLVGLLIVAAPFPSIGNVEDPLAVLSGVAGGGLGASVLELARNKVYGNRRK
jgi:hypothetical protein